MRPISLCPACLPFELMTTLPGVNMGPSDTWSFPRFVLQQRTIRPLIGQAPQETQAQLCRKIFATRALPRFIPETEDESYASFRAQQTTLYAKRLDKLTANIPRNEILVDSVLERAWMRDVYIPEHFHEYFDTQKVYTTSLGHSLRFTGMILGCGANAAVFEATITLTDGTEKKCAVSTLSHGLPNRGFLSKYMHRVQATRIFASLGIGQMDYFGDMFAENGLMAIVTNLVDGKNLGFVNTNQAPNEDEIPAEIKPRVIEQLQEIAWLAAQAGFWLRDIEYRVNDRCEVQIMDLDMASYLPNMGAETLYRENLHRLGLKGFQADEIVERLEFLAPQIPEQAVSTEWKQYWIRIRTILEAHLTPRIGQASPLTEKAWSVFEHYIYNRSANPDFPVYFLFDYLWSDAHHDLQEEIPNVVPAQNRYHQYLETFLEFDVSDEPITHDIDRSLLELDVIPDIDFPDFPHANNLLLEALIHGQKLGLTDEAIVRIMKIYFAFFAKVKPQNIPYHQEYRTIAQWILGSIPCPFKT